MDEIKHWLKKNTSLFLAILAALSIRWALIEAYVIPSGSMLPTLLIHDHIFVNKIVYGLRFPFTKKWFSEFSQPEKGDVIVFKYPEDESTFFIKRVVGAPGDKIFVNDTTVYINDVAVEKIPADQDIKYLALDDEDVPPGISNYDHFTENLASRSHSVLYRKDVHHMGVGPINVPEGQYFVMGDNRDNSRDSRFWGYVPRENLVGKAMFIWLSCERTLPIVSFICNPLTIRWNRFFNPVK